jgi:hypothetical protein
MHARIVMIVQSSGMGKSRMIDELSKKHFVIPLNLRNGESGRFFCRLISKLKPLTSNLLAIQLPTPRSAPGLKYLGLVLPKAISAAVLSSPHWSRKRWTLLKTQNTQQQIYNAITESPNLGDQEKAAAQQNYPSTIQEQFRLFMTVGQTFSKQSDLRIEFYDRVVERANEVGFPYCSSAAMLTAMCSYSVHTKRPQNTKHKFRLRGELRRTT